MSKGKKSSRRSGAQSADPNRPSGKKGGSRVEGLFSGNPNHPSGKKRCSRVGGQSPAEPLSVPEGLPSAFLARMQADLENKPVSFEQFYKSYERAPVHAFMPNTMRGASAASFPFVLSDERIPWNPDGAVYEESPDNRPGKHALHEAGAYYIQEASAMLPVRMLLDASPECFDGLRVLDLCAAPGGKSTQLAMAMQGHGILICNEIHPSRAETLSRNIERMGIRNAVVTQTAPAQLRSCLPSCFDLILVDAPCSGEGMFRRNPEAIREWSPEATELCAQRQREILDDAADMLRPGGIMVYSTCTFAPAEDEEQTQSFLSTHPDFTLLREVKLLPDCVLKAETKSLPDRGFEAATESTSDSAQKDRYTSVSAPLTGHWEGHYAAAFCHHPADQHHVSAESDLSGNTLVDGGNRPASTLVRSAASYKPGPVPMPPASFDRPDPVLQKRFCEWLHTVVADPAVIDFDPARLILFGSSLFLMPQLTPSLPGIHVLRPGLKLAEIKKTRTDIEFLPAHAFSHALAPGDAVCSASLTDAQAAAYLNGQTLAVGSLSLLSYHPHRPKGDQLSDTRGCSPAPEINVQEENESRYVLVTCCGFSLGWARRSGATLKNLYPKGLRVSL